MNVPTTKSRQQRLSLRNRLEKSPAKQTALVLFGGRSWHWCPLSWRLQFDQEIQILDAIFRNGEQKVSTLPHARVRSSRVAPNASDLTIIQQKENISGAIYQVNYHRSLLRIHSCLEVASCWTERNEARNEIWALRRSPSKY